MWWKRSGAIVATIALAAMGTLAMSPSDAGAEEGSRTFPFTGAPEPFVVPAEVCLLSVSASGAQGGLGSNFGSTRPAAAQGGRANVSIPVTPGETLWITVGGAGTDGSSSFPPLVALPGQGGWPDGGNGGGATAGGQAGGDLPGIVGAGGGGGGSSDVRRGGSTVASRVVVAGGGGGGATFAFVQNLAPGSISAGGSYAAGGEGGGTAGSPGPISGGVLALTAAGGGTESAGGTAGSPGGALPGAVGLGGDGGAASDEASSAFGSVGVATGGGGAGGGFFGGGGGGAAATATADESSVTRNGRAGGGAGGSGLGPSGTVFETGVRTGNGEVTLSWTTSRGCTAVAFEQDPRFVG